MIEKLEEIDRSIFIAINSWHNDIMDSFMYLVSHKLFWIPFYLLIFYVVQRRFNWKGLAFFALAVAVTVTLSDQISSSLFKPFFARYRPCNNLDLIDIVHTVRGRCGSGFSFISGHATNFFALATLTAYTIRGGKYAVILMLWAGLISYSRVYLGVHYPADITLGAIVGVLVGYSVHRLFTKLIDRKMITE